MGKDLFNGGIKELDEVKAAEVEACRPKPTAPLALMGPDSGLGPTPKLSSDPDKVTKKIFSINFFSCFLF